MHSRRFGISLFAAALALALSGSGGGGGTVPAGDSNAESELSIVDNWQRFEAGNPTLRMSNAQIGQAYESRSRRASHQLTWSVASVGGEGAGESIVVEVDSHEYEVRQLPPGSTVSFSPVLKHNEIPVADMKARVIFEDKEFGVTVLTDIVTYGGWLDHTVFGIGVSAACDVDAPVCSGTSPVYALGFADGFTPFRVYSGTTPTGMGTATWTGIMVEMESPRFENEAAALAWKTAGQLDVYLDDARIMIEDLAPPDVYVSFTNIHNVTEGARHRDMGREGLSVDYGLFRGGDSDEYRVTC